jgi:hypothetical protein
VHTEIEKPSYKKHWHCHIIFKIFLVIAGAVGGHIAYMATISSVVVTPKINPTVIHPHDISYKNFLTLTADGVDKYNTQIIKCYGGSWDKSVFPTTFSAPTADGLVSGWLFYYGADVASSTSKEIFLAGRTVANFDPTATTLPAPASTASYTYTRTTKPFLYTAPTSGTTTYEKNETYMRSGTTTGTTSTPCSTSAQMASCYANFKGKVASTSTTENYGGFILGDEIVRLLGQTPPSGKTVAGIRYFLSYDDSENKNKIKAVFCAFDSDNNNMLINGSLHYITMERSWPPIIF